MENKTLWSPYLIAIHFEFAHDLDSHFTKFSGGIFCAVDIAERAIAHLLHQDPAIEAGILRHLRPACPLFLNEAFDFDRPIGFHLRVIFLLGGLTMSLVTSHVTGIQDSVSRRIFMVWLWLLFGVDGGDVGGGFGMGRHQASLFPMPDEILDILYRAHDESKGRKLESMSCAPMLARGKGKKSRRVSDVSDVGWSGSQRQFQLDPATEIKVGRRERDERLGGETKGDEDRGKRGKGMRMRKKKKVTGEPDMRSEIGPR